MSEVLRPQPNTSEELHNQRRNQLTFNMAELAVLSIINPMEMVKSVEANVVTLAIDPELELQKIKEEELALYA